MTLLLFALACSHDKGGVEVDSGGYSFNDRVHTIVKVVDDSRHFVAIDSAEGTFCATASDGSVLCKSATGSSGTEPAGVQNEVPEVRLEDVSVSGDFGGHACGREIGGGGVRCWGCDERFETSCGTFDSKWTMVRPFSFSTCYQGVDGMIACIDVGESLGAWDPAKWSGRTEPVAMDGYCWVFTENPQVALCAMKRALFNPHGWEVVEGGGEGLPDLIERGRLRGALNCVAGENAMPRNANPNTDSQKHHNVVESEATRSSGSDGLWSHSGNPSGPILTVPDGMDTLGVWAWITNNKTDPISAQLEVVRSSGPNHETTMPLGPAFELTKLKPIYDGVVVSPGDRIRLTFSGGTHGVEVFYKLACTVRVYASR